MRSIRKLLLVTDTWHPQVNGVVRTLDTTVRHLAGLGCQVQVLEPSQFLNLPCPVYPGFRLTWPSARRLTAIVRGFQPDAVHIANEASLGLAVRLYCVERGLRFTTAYHTRSPEYLRRMVGFPAAVTYHYLRWFHCPAAATMVTTPSVEQELRRHGFTGRLVRWSRGVDLDLFHPRPGKLPGERPILLYVGRVSVEKNLEAFLGLPVAGTKYVAGDGPAKGRLQERYPAACFLGQLRGEALAQVYAGADVLVFPSKTDTFGLVILEALASGVPVAAHPAPGPADILTVPGVGALDPDLGRAVALALAGGDRDTCLGLARQYTWANSARQFLGNLVLASRSSTEERSRAGPLAPGSREEVAYTQTRISPLPGTEVSPV
jgi:glycosyltransferase involved in cell wall biosynthesis